MVDLWWAGFLVLVGAGLTAGLVTILSPSRPASDALEPDPLVARLRVRVRTGREQIVIRLGRDLGIALRREDVGYGELYVAESSASHLVVASRSEIGRSFEGEVQLRRLPASTVVDYFVHSMPQGGAELENAVQQLERDLLHVLTQLDPAIEVLHARTAPGPALRRLVPRLRAGQASGAERAADAERVERTDD